MKKFSMTLFLIAIRWVPAEPSRSTYTLSIVAGTHYAPTIDRCHIERVRLVNGGIIYLASYGIGIANIVAYLQIFGIDPVFAPQRQNM
jgi:hypothetical protein